MTAIGRREWFTSAVAASAGLCVESAVAIPQKPLVCGLGIGSYGLQSLKLEDAIKLIAETGFDVCDISSFPGSTGEPEELDAARRKALRNVITDSGLRLSALGADLRPSADDKVHAERSAQLREILELGKAISPSGDVVVQATLGGKDWEKEKALFRDRLADWMQTAADFKAILAIKPHRGSAMSKPSEAVWIFEQLGKSKWLRMTYDYSHFAFRQPPMSIADTVATSLPWIQNVAVKDTIVVDGKARFALPGDGGNWDNADIIRAFCAGGYRGDFVCEVSAQIWKGDPDYEPVAATRKCFENMVAAFERAEVERG